MRPFSVSFVRGWLRAPGKRSAANGVTYAKNARFLPGAPNLLWSILGRTKFNAAPVGLSSFPTNDEATIKTIFTVQFDGASPKLVLHKGGTLWEAPLGLTGAFAQAQVMAQSAGDVIPRGIPAAFRGFLNDTVWYYPVGQTNRADTYRLWARTSAGWRVGGHYTPTATFTVAGNGAGSYGSNTDIWLTYRIYDAATGLEGAHGPVYKLNAPGSTFARLRWTWPAGITLQGSELGSHVRLYATLPNEIPGIMYRVDGTGDGLPLNFPPGSLYDMAASATTMQIQGTVRADGEEGTLLWAEHGGQPPLAGGVIPFKEHMVYYDLPGRQADIIASAQGFPESVPVDFDGEYVYWQRFQSGADNRVLRCLRAGGYLLVLCRNSIHRVYHIPTFIDPGFSQNAQELVTADHGLAGRYAADSFGIGSDQSQWVVYVSTDHGLMLTDALSQRQIVAPLQMQTLVEPDRFESIELVNYPKMQELWMFYTPRRAERVNDGIGNTVNTMALIVDYSTMREGGMGLRVTGPVPVRAVAACYGAGTDKFKRLYLTDDVSGTVYVQDSGNIDAQQNHNAAGDLEFDWQTARYFPVLGRSMIQVHRGLIYGFSGVARELTIHHYSLEGRDEYEEICKATIGPGETSDEFYVEASGQAFRERLRFVGQTGVHYDRELEGCALCVEVIEYDWSRCGAVMVTAGD